MLPFITLTSSSLFTGGGPRGWEGASHLSKLNQLLSGYNRFQTSEFVGSLIAPNISLSWKASPSRVSQAIWKSG